MYNVIVDSNGVSFVKSEFTKTQLRRNQLHNIRGKVRRSHLLAFVRSRTTGSRSLPGSSILQEFFMSTLSSRLVTAGLTIGMIAILTFAALWGGAASIPGTETVVAAGGGDGQSPSGYGDPVVAFSSEFFDEDEGQTAAITLTRTGDTTGTTTVNVATVPGGTATAGVDFQPVNTNVTFMPGATQATVPVRTIFDLRETGPPEGVVVRFSDIGGRPVPHQTAIGDDGSRPGGANTATLRIHDSAAEYDNDEQALCITRGGTSNIYPSNITVSGETEQITDMRVTLFDLSHPFPDNIDALLVGPGGQKFVLMSKSGGSNAIGPNSTISLTFGDDAGEVLPDSGALTWDEFEPTSWGGPVTNFPAPAPAGPYSEPGSAVGGTGTQTLSGRFGGTSANGVWSLYLRDNSGVPISPGDIAGCFNDGWGIEFAPQFGTTTTITNTASLSSTPTSVGTSYAVNWTVNAVEPAAGTPTGTVTVTDGSGFCTAAVSAGTCNLTSTTPGLKTITASYAGEGNFAGSTSAGTPHTVLGAPTPTPTPTPTPSPTPSPTPLGGTGLEADIAPRPNGGGGLTAVDSAQFKRFLAGLDTFSTTENEYQRTDVAPRLTAGDGRLDATDQQQINNYIAVIDQPATGGGPTGPAPGPAQERSRSDDEIAEGRERTYRIVSTSGARGAEIIVTIEIDARGNETGMSFTLNFDPSKLSFSAVGGTNNNSDVMDGSGSPAGMNRTLNATQADNGKLGLLLDAASPFEAGTRQIVALRFRVLADAVPGSTALTFDDDLLVRSTTNAEASFLDGVYQNGEVTIKPSRTWQNVSWMLPSGSVWPALGN